MTQFNNVTDLPKPDADSIAHSQLLVQRIQTEINRQSGIIGFDEFMRMALYEPGLGYYSAGLRKFGEDGDFVTAPEISSVFSQCLAKQCEEVIRNIDNSIVLELGAGTGIMAADILLELQRRDALPAQYWILEVSADLKQRQQERLKSCVPFFYEKIHWLDQLPEEKFSGIVIGNEVIDALPVKRFIKKDNRLFELGVTAIGDNLNWQVTEKTLSGIDLVDTLSDEYTSEFNSGLSDWLSSIADTLEQGILLFLDYGYPAKEYYHPERTAGTLLCHYRHCVHDDPFYYPGLQDITSSVNFTYLAECAHESGLQVAGYTSQSAFLIATGLEEFVDINDSDNQQRAATSQAIRTLTLPSEMGERVKVMALTKAYDQPLLGFSFMDQRFRL